MVADIQIAGSPDAVIKNLHSRRASSGIVEEQNRAPHAGAAVGDENGTARGRGVDELRNAAECAGGRAGVAGEGAAARGRSLVEMRGAAACAANEAAIVREDAAARGRDVEEIRGGTSSERDHGTIVGEGAAAGGGVLMERDKAGDVVSEGCIAPGGCAVIEFYRCVSYKILCNS